MKLDYDLYAKACEFAGNAHKGQKIIDTSTSYLVHCSAVAQIAICIAQEENLDINLVSVVALLHDTIEDTEIDYDQIQSVFGTQVADGVRALTKNKMLPKQEQMIDSLKRIKKQPKEIWVIKLADRYFNLRNVPESWTKEKIEFYKKEAILIFNELKDASKELSVKLLRKIQHYGK